MYGNVTDLILTAKKGPTVQKAQVMQGSELPGRLHHYPLCAPTQHGAAVALHNQDVVKSWCPIQCGCKDGDMSCFLLERRLSFIVVKMSFPPRLCLTTSALRKLKSSFLFSMFLRKPVFRSFLGIQVWPSQILVRGPRPCRWCMSAFRLSSG